jgi:hypothetical protein
MISQLLAGMRGLGFAALMSASIAAPLAWHMRGWQDASVIALAEIAQARAEKKLADLNAAVASNLAEIERARADAEAKALSIAKAESVTILNLQARLAASERERLALSTRTRQELSPAPIADARELGPAALRYLDRVRAQQSGP